MSLEQYYQVASEDMVAVANKIRTKGGTQAALEWPDDWKDAIDAISGSVSHEIIATWGWNFSSGQLGFCALKNTSGDVFITYVGNNTEKTTVGNLASIKWYGGSISAVVTALTDITVYVYAGVLGETTTPVTPTVSSLSTGDTFTLPQQSTGTQYYVDIYAS